MKITTSSRLLLLTLALVASLARGAEVQPLPDDPKCTDAERALMKRANELAASALAKGNTPYGALLARNGKIVMEFENDARTSGDVTHHAETGLISKASREFGKEALADTVLYTSTEPCIMCCGSIRALGLKKFVYGTTAIQVQKQRGTPLPKNPLQCREVFARIGMADVVILGPLLEKEGLAVHAKALGK